jgi:hypothetical protein
MTMEQKSDKRLLAEAMAAQVIRVDEERFPNGMEVVRYVEVDGVITVFEQPDPQVRPDEDPMA